MQQNLTDELRQGLADFLAFVPRLAAAIGILMIGFVLAKMIERIVNFLLVRIRFDRWMREGGVTEALERAGTELKPSSVLGRLTFWGIMLLVIIIGANALGISAVSVLFGELLAYVPNVIAAVIVLILGILLGEFIKDLVLASAGSLGGVVTLARAAKAAVILLATFMALEQLDIAQDIVLVFFIAVVGAAALAAAIAFGVGGRAIAEDIIRNWYARSQGRIASPSTGEPAPSDTAPPSDGGGAGG